MDEQPRSLPSYGVGYTYCHTPFPCTVLKRSLHLIIQLLPSEIRQYISKNLVLDVHYCHVISSNEIYHIDVSLAYFLT
jgi:hypothetical protein